MPGPPFALAAAELALCPRTLDPGQVLEGTPEVSELVLSTSVDGRVERGVWQLTEGVVADVEADELFVVVSGRATVEIEGGPTLELRPGDVGLLRAGDRTVWRVHETLRKVYQATLPASPGS
ncbi:MAG TPA: cupin domain-containing protein [Gaiellaceae bacterium]|nr:cupin domain-containing protein [Gaiellaceae bacterium]